MSRSTRNPASLAAGRASDLFGLAAEHPEINQPSLCVQGNVVGIDPGVVGALALLSRDGGLIGVADMPILRDGSGGRPAVNAPLLAEFLARWRAREVICEFVSARPKEGAVGAFSFGRCRGVIEGVCAVMGLPIAFVTVPSWKRRVGIAPGKAGAIRSDPPMARQGQLLRSRP